MATTFAEAAREQAARSMGQQRTVDEAETERAERYAGEDLVDGMIEAVAEGLDALMRSPLGRRHEHLAACPEEALLALLGHPPDARDCWTALSADLRGAMMVRQGLASGTC